MCLAVPMKVIELEGEQDDFFNPPVATVEAEGMMRKIRLDIVDRFPRVGDYVIVHAGFAIHTLSPGEANESLRLFDEMGKYIPGVNDGE